MFVVYGVEVLLLLCGLADFFFSLRILCFSSRDVWHLECWRRFATDDVGLSAMFGEGVFLF